MVVATIAQRLSGFAREAGAPLGDIALPMDESCSLASVTALDDGLLAVRLAGPRSKGCETVLLVDLEAARVVGRLQAGEAVSGVPAN